MSVHFHLKNKRKKREKRSKTGNPMRFRGAKISRMGGGEALGKKIKQLVVRKTAWEGKRKRKVTFHSCTVGLLLTSWKQWLWSGRSKLLQQNPQIHFTSQFNDFTHAAHPGTGKQVVSAPLWPSHLKSLSV